MFRPFNTKQIKISFEATRGMPLYPLSLLRIFGVNNRVKR